MKHFLKILKLDGKLDFCFVHSTCGRYDGEDFRNEIR